MGNHNPQKTVVHYAKTEAKRLSNYYQLVDRHLREELLKDCLENIDNNVKPPDEYVFDPKIKYIHSMCYPDVQLDAYKHSLWRLRTITYDQFKL